MNTKELLKRIRRNAKTTLIVGKEYERDVLKLCDEVENLLREIEDLRQHVLEISK